MHHHIIRRPDFIHHQENSITTSAIREAVFGLQDGMVSTFGSVTGIAAATGDPKIVLLAGSIIIAVESISMGAGSYLSSKSERQINERKLFEEKTELHEYPEEEEAELLSMFKEDGWPSKLAKEMAATAAKDKKLFLQEMAYRELKVFPDHQESPGTNALVMLISYIVGGFVPLLPYFLLTVPSAIPTSVIASLVGLFLVGAITTKFSKLSWWKAGLEMLFLAGLAGAVGYYIGQISNSILK